MICRPGRQKISGAHPPFPGRLESLRALRSQDDIKKSRCQTTITLRTFAVDASLQAKKNRNVLRRGCERMRCCVSSHMCVEKLRARQGQFHPHPHRPAHRKAPFFGALHTACTRFRATCITQTLCSSTGWAHALVHSTKRGPSSPSMAFIFRYITVTSRAIARCALSNQVPKQPSATRN